MATFYNQATLTYNGRSTVSNVVAGEFLETVSAVKTSVGDTYRPGESITYIITLTNSGTTPLTGLTVKDDLGTYTSGTLTLTPLTYNTGTIRYFANGVLQTAPTISSEDPLTVTGISVPAGGNTAIIYETTVNSFAPPETGSVITNTVTVTGADIVTEITASAAITVEDGAELTITKSVTPSTVSDNDTLTYTFVIQNNGNTAATAADNIVLNDTFDPVLNGLTVTYNGTPWTEGTNYTYTAGVFATNSGAITVPAAAYVQDPVTGEWSITPGVTTVTVSGTV